MEICGIVPPRRHELLRYEDLQCLCECIIPVDVLHSSHVFQKPDGSYMAWADDWECGCCEPEEHDRCYTYWEITEDEVHKLMEAQK